VGPAASGFGNTLSAVFAGRDHTDLFFVDGVAASLARVASPFWSVGASAWHERHRAAGPPVSGGPLDHGFRPLFPALAGDMTGGELRLERRAPYGTARWTTGELRLDGGSFQPLCTLARCATALRHARSQVAALAGWRWEPRRSLLELEGRGGMMVGDAPPQSLFHLGGRGTVPGYAFRTLVGERYLAARATGSVELDDTWLRARLHGGAGWADLTGGPVRPSVGAGVGILHDVLHVDLHRGLGRGGRWELIVESNRGFWDFL
jgi:hypothetical protein